MGSTNMGKVQIWESTNMGKYKYGKYKYGKINRSITEQGANLFLGSGSVIYNCIYRYIGFKYTCIYMYTYNWYEYIY